jgi:MFS family permease
MIRAALPTSRDARWILLGTLFSAIGRGLTLPFLFIYLNQVRGLEAGTVGLLVGWMGAVALALAPVGGSLVDRLGPRHVVLPCLAIEAVGTASLAFVEGTWSAFGVLTLIALGGATLWSAQITLLATLVTPEERQRTFGLSFTLLNLGIGIGGVVSGAVVDTSRAATFQAIYFGDAVSYLVPAVILLVLSHVGRRAVVDAPVTDAGTEPSRGGYAQVLRDRAFVHYIIFALTLTTVGYAQIEIGFTAFSTVVAKVPPGVIGWALAANTLVIVVAQLFVVRWLEGRSRTRALAVVGLIFATSWVVLAGAGIAGGNGARAVAIAGVIACSVIFAMGETLLSPIMPAITNALATDELRGRYNAMGSMIWGVSGIVGPIAAGPLIGGGRAAWWAVLVICGSLVASLLALGLYRRLTPAQDGRQPATPTFATTQDAVAAAADPVADRR